MKIARVVLEMALTKSGLDSNARWWAGAAGRPKDWKEYKWDAFRESVFITDFHPDPDRYVARIRSLLSNAAQRGANLVLLPACALMSRIDESPNAYISGTKLTVVAGIQTVGKRSTPIWTSSAEGALVATAGKIEIAFCGGPVRLSLDGRPLLAAISSSIERIHEVTALAAASNKTALALDMGHHQYGARHLIHRLRRVQAALNSEGRAFVAQSYWAWNASSSYADWIQPKKATWWKRIPSEHSTTPWVDAEGCTRNDRVDIFEVD